MQTEKTVQMQQDTTVQMQQNVVSEQGQQVAFRRGGCAIFLYFYIEILKLILSKMSRIYPNLFCKRVP